MSARRVVVIGAGVGGLAAAVRLRAAGLEVTVLERAAAPGGKMREVPVGGLRIDAGPSVLTMPQVFDELFAVAGQRREDFVRFVPCEPACRHFFADGVVLDLFNDDSALDPPWERTVAEVRRVLGARAAEQYRAYRRHTAGLYEVVREPFMYNALPGNPLGLFFAYGVKKAMDIARIDSRRTLWQALQRLFEDEHLRVLFARYATYCGSDPFRAPATFNVIPQVELGLGLYSVEGGMYRLAEALAQLAQQLGVKLRYGADVEAVELSADERRAVAVRAGGERLAADAVVANCDVAQLSARLLQGTRVGARGAAQVARQPASLSAYLRLVAARDTEGLPLAHHNVFFSADYPAEFEALSGRGEPPDEPTVYLCAPPGPAPRWFLLSNAPALPAGQREAGWAARDALCRARLVPVLARHGVDLDRHAAAEVAVTPEDFERLFPHSRGALYGAASHSRMSAFQRPKSRVPGCANLYCVGGSAHPGAGVPMVALSARIAAAALLEDVGRE